MLRKLSPQKQQHGQAIIFVVLFLGVVTLSLVFLYKAGKITSEKMQIQNAADAAAYSVSLTEARDLNFMAYTNRAMVANEVAIGQMVGLASWAAHWESFGYYLMAYYRIFIGPIVSTATLGTAAGPVEGVFQAAATVFKSTGAAAFTIFKVIGNISATVLSTINKVYGVVQTAYHYASILMGISAYVDVVNDNAPNAKISDFGMMSLIAHTLTYTDIIPSYDSFIKTYTPTQAENAEGFERLAGIINGSRDEFSRNRGWDLGLPDPFPIDLDYTCSSGCPQGNSEQRFEIDVPPGITLGTLFLELRFYFQMQLLREGGSELRYKGDTATGTKFNWSAADSTNLTADLIFSVEAGFEPFIGPSVSAGVDISMLPDGVSLKLNFDPVGTLFEETLAFTPTAPFSSGAAQIGATQLTSADLMGIDREAYGGSAGKDQTWYLGVPFTPSAAPTAAPFVPVTTLTMPSGKHKINTTYSGLQMYNDNILKDNPWGIEAPYFLAGVVIDDVDIYRNTAPLKTVGPNTNPGQLINNTNFFYLDDSQVADQELGAIAKSEVYFSRPTDLSYFSRADDAEEYGSAFNPYWQARLVQTTNADRVLSIAIQQKQTFGVLDQLADLTSLLGSTLEDMDPADWFP
jgi:uncharacterized membrane protein (Fun14 family)